MRRLLRLLTIVLLASVLASVPTTATGSDQQAKKAGGPPNTTFNIPRPWGGPPAQNRILNRIDRAIDGVPRPSKKHPSPVITISSYLLDHTVSVTKLINACKRGVGVRVVLDSDISNRNSARLVRAFNSDNVKDRNHDGKPDHGPRSGRCGRPLPDYDWKPSKQSGDKSGRPSGRELPPRRLNRRQLSASLDTPTGDSVTWGKDRSYVKKCHGACRNAGGGGNTHTKFYLFSQTGAHKHVVMVSSANLNRGGAQNGWNDLYVMNDREKSYKFYLQVHRAMTQQLRSSTKRLQVTDGPYISRFFPMRNAGKRNDPTLQDLKAISCKSAIGPTQIHVSMFYWAGPRGNYLASQLLNLARQGCQVSLIYGAPSRKLAARLRAAAGAHLISLYDSRWDFNEDGYNEVRTHGKFVTVRGTYKGDRSAHVVMTGSPNWVQGSLSLADENSLNINLASAYKQYQREWVVIRNHSRRLPKNS